MQNLLFICGKARLRSPTAEQLFSTWPDIQTASAGTSGDADAPVTPELIQWAHIIFVMEQTHRTKLASRFQQSLKNKRIVVLNIPDDYAYMDPRLVALLTERVRPHLAE